MSLLGLFLALTIGVPLHKHYCGVQLYSAGILEQDCCCEESGEKEDLCCSSETAYFNIDQSYEQLSFHKVKFSLPFLVDLRPQTFEIELRSEKPVVTPKAQTRHLHRKVPIYKMHQELIVYG